VPELFDFAYAVELLSQACFSQGPISPMEMWRAMVPEIAEFACWSWPPPISGMVIPAMAIPAMLMPPDAEASLLACSEWQSELIEANAQETSHAAPSEHAESSSARIEHAKMRLRIIWSFSLRQSCSVFQPQETLGSESATIMKAPGPSRKTRFTENVLRERDGPAATKPSCLALAFVEAARFWGGHALAQEGTKRNRLRRKGLT